MTLLPEITLYRTDGHAALELPKRADDLTVIYGHTEQTDQFIVDAMGAFEKDITPEVTSALTTLTTPLGLSAQMYIRPWGHFFALGHPAHFVPWRFINASHYPASAISPDFERSATHRLFVRPHGLFGTFREAVGVQLENRHGHVQAVIWPDGTTLSADDIREAYEVLFIDLEAGPYNDPAHPLIAPYHAALRRYVENNVMIEDMLDDVVITVNQQGIVSAAFGQSADCPAGGLRPASIPNGILRPAPDFAAGYWMAAMMGRLPHSMGVG